MNKHIKKVLIAGLIGVNISIGMTSFASADTGAIGKLENLVIRMEKASKTMPTHFQKSTLVNIKNVKMVKDEYGGKKIVGTITNTTGADLTSVILEYETSDKAGNVLKYNSTVITQKIKNGGTINFTGDVMDAEKAISFKLKSVQVKVDNIN